MYKLLIRIAVIVLILLGIFLIVEIGHVSNTAATTNNVSFSGEGKVLARPDIATVSLSIVTEASTSKAAQDENSSKSAGVVNFLKNKGIDDKDIKTIGYNIYPTYAYPYNKNPQITGYRVDQTLEVKIRDLNKVSEVLDGVVSAGVNQVNNLAFNIDNPDKLKADARSKAIDDAKTKAKELEKQLGIKLGRIINFSENVGGYPQPMIYEKGLGVGGGGGPTVPTGENEIVVDITLTYQIK